MLLGLENLNFVKLNIGYQTFNFQICLLSRSNFMEVSVIHQKTPLSRHYDVNFYHWVSKLEYFVQNDIGYQPSMFQFSRMFGSNFMEGVFFGGVKNTPNSSALTG